MPACTAVLGVASSYERLNANNVSKTLCMLGDNSGNLLFTEALMRILNETVLVTKHDIISGHSKLNDYGAIVIAAANWLNEYEDFGWLSKELEQTEVPVYLIGVGIQADIGAALPTLPLGTVRMLSIISERSALISTRGIFSSEILEKLGIMNSVPTGCPSLLLAGSKRPILRKASNLDVVMHGTRHGFLCGDKLQNALYRAAFEKKYQLILQSETADIECIAAGLGTRIPEESMQMLRLVYNSKNDLSIAEYLSEFASFHTNIHSWMNHLKSVSFCIGSRFHATIAAIIAGTPALLITHDKRTLELADTMGIPHVFGSMIDDSHLLNIDVMIEAFNSSSFLDNFVEYRENFEHFFSKNQLDTRKNPALLGDF